MFAVAPVDAVACGPLVLWLGLLRKMGLRQALDRLLPTEAEVSHGQVLEALVLNRLLAPQPLYRIEAWARDRGFAAVTGCDPTRLNDDRLGRALDALAARVQDAQAAVTTHVVTAFQVATADAHYDTTTAYFEGDYADSDLAAHGHSKDRRADHKQVVIGLVAAADGEIPLAHATYPGNTADVTTVPPMLRALRACLPTDPVVVSGDCAMWSQANRDATAAAGGIFLGPIAMIASVAAWVCAATPDVAVSVPLVGQRAPVLYQACVVGRFAVAGVADAGVHLVVYDPRRAAAEAAERHQALGRDDAARTRLGAQLNRGRLKTSPQVTTRLAALARRHGLAARYVTATLAGAAGTLMVTWQRDAAALAAAPQRDGKWPLVTNKAGLTDPELCVWAVRRDKGHGRVERDQHLLKGPLAVRPFFVQTDDRIRALVAICAWALTAWTLLERQARQALPPPLQPRKALPLVARVEALLAAVTLMTFRVGEAATLHRAVTPLPPRVQSLLHGLGWSREVRALLDAAVQVRIQA